MCVVIELPGSKSRVANMSIIIDEREREMEKATTSKYMTRCSPPTTAICTLTRDEGPDAVPPHERTQRHAIGAQTPPAVGSAVVVAGVGVRLGGRADVAPLDVQEHRHVAIEGADALDDPTQRRHAVPVAEGLEEGGVGLVAHRVGVRGVDDAGAEPVRRLGAAALPLQLAVAPPPVAVAVASVAVGIVVVVGAELGGVRVEADAQEGIYGFGSGGYPLEK